MNRRWENSKSEKVCSIDIDGVMNYYPQTWIDFVNNHGKFGEFDDLQEMKSCISYQAYRDLKYKYRSSGIKERLELRVGAKEVTHMLKAWGYKIIMLTARPFDEISTLQIQTIRWLNNNQIPYDQIIHGKDKYVKVMTQIPNLRFHVEDHRYYANLIGQWGYIVYLVDNQYNQGELNDNVIRIADLEEILDNEQS